MLVVWVFRGWSVETWRVTLMCAAVINVLDCLGGPCARATMYAVGHCVCVCVWKRVVCRDFCQAEGGCWSRLRRAWLFQCTAAVAATRRGRAVPAIMAVGIKHRFCEANKFLQLTRIFHSIHCLELILSQIWCAWNWKHKVWFWSWRAIDNYLIHKFNECNIVTKINQCKQHYFVGTCMVR
jgi:hypothetical protein